MHEYKKHYIAFLDILGFKEMIKDKTCEDIHKILSTKMKKPLSGVYKGTTSVVDMNDIKQQVMSDSICFYIECNKRNALAGLIFTCAYFQEELLRLEEPILIRGAIIQGDLYADDRIIFGPGFVRAYQMEEHCAKFPRIIVTKSTLDEALDDTEENIRDYISQTVFCDFDEFYVVDYMELFEGFDTSGEDCRYLLKYINSILGATTDSSVREKYLYLKKYLLHWYKPELCGRGT